MSWLKGLLIAWIIVSGISFLILWRLLYVQSQERKAQDELNAAFVVQIAGVQKRVSYVECAKVAKGDGDFPVYIYHIKGRG